MLTHLNIDIPEAPDEKIARITLSADDINIVRAGLRQRIDTIKSASIKLPLYIGAMTVVLIALGVMLLVHVGDGGAIFAGTLFCTSAGLGIATILRHVIKGCVCPNQLDTSISQADKADFSLVARSFDLSLEGKSTYQVLQIFNKLESDLSSPRNSKRIAFLMGDHKKNASNQKCVTHHAFFKNPIFDKHVIKEIFECSETEYTISVDNAFGIVRPGPNRQAT